MMFLILTWILFSTIPAFAQTFPLGTISPLAGGDSTCPAGFTCRGLKVTCPGTPQVATFYATRLTVNPVGTVIFFTGGAGTTYWSSANEFLPSFVNDLIALRYNVLQVRWKSEWEASARGLNSGIAKLACRPATMISYLHKTFQPATSRLIITGNSGGASQVSYPLAYYGLDQIVDVMIPTGGPPHSALQKSCMQNAGEDGYWFDAGRRSRIDNAFGFFSANGPCYLRDGRYIPRWTAESVAYGGTDYFYDNTRVHMIIGAKDRIQVIASDYEQKLTDSGTPVVLEILPNVGHDIFDYSLGRDALFSAITQR